jgi:phenylalanyl-tRNA synthetase beta chain
VKITYQWFKEFAPTAASPQELASRLTLAGLEVESVEAVAPPFSDVRVGEVLECSRHPDAEKLSVCKVTTDGANRLQIICGASNVRAGLKVAVAMIGAKLPDNVAIKRAKLRGLESEGMLCSARELKLGDEHEGIMELDADATLNLDLREALQLDDATLEVNATPNRGDCMSVFGIARDYVAAHERRYLDYPKYSAAAVSDETFPSAVQSPGCPLMGTRVIRGVNPKAQSPGWMRERLRRVGLNSISLIVDVTNLVMMELGQPLHAYDLAKLSGRLIARQARAGERITLLDDKEYGLEPDFLVIADEKGAVGLAGIMGGRPTAISDDTKDVLLEAAHFLPDAVAGRARRLGLFTDAGQRFERGVDPKLPAVALERAAELILAYGGGSAGPVQIQGTAGEGAATVTLRRARLARLLGATVPDPEIKSVMQAISQAVESTAEGFRVARASHRFDVRIEADLIEEVARLRGFDKVQEQHASAPQIAGVAPEGHVAGERLFSAMTDRGYAEVINYTFVDPQLQRLLFPDSKALALSNPIASDLAEMRVSLWPGLLKTCRDNLRRQQSRVRLFEIGKKFLVRESTHEPLAEVETLAGIALGSRLPEQWGIAREPLDFYDVKADLEALLSLTGANNEFKFVAEQLPCLRPGRSARIYRNDVAVGWLGELHPQLVKTINLPNTAFIFELEIDLAFIAKPSKFREISKFPSVRRDLAIVVDESVTLAVLRENVSVSASGLLRDLRVFDVYRGPGIETGRKSVALGLILQDSSRTLTDVDADAVVAKVVARLRDVLSATIRDQ